MSADASSSRWPVAALALLVAIHAAQTAWVALADQTPPYLAVYEHHGSARRILDGLGWAGRADAAPTAHGPGVDEVDPARELRRLPFPIRAIVSLFRASFYRPPAPLVAALPGMLVWPERWSAGAIAGVAWTAVLLTATFSIGRRLASPATGLLAAIVLGAFPGILGQRALVSPFLPEGACVAAFAAALLATRAGERYATVRLGIWAGLAMLCRWDAFAFLASLVTWHVWARPPGTRRGAVIALWRPVLVFAAVAGPWYAWSLSGILGVYRQEGILSTRHAHEGIDLFSFENLAYHPYRLFSMHAGPVLGVASALSLAWLLWRRHRGVSMLVAWIGLSWLFYIVVPMKASRYMLPAACPFAVALALAARDRGRAVMMVVAAVALIQQLALVHDPRVERAWNRRFTDPRTWGERRTLWEASVDAGRIRPWTDPTWSDEVLALQRALGPPYRVPTTILLADEGTSEYLVALDLEPGLTLLVASEVRDDRVTAVVTEASFIVLATPFPEPPAGPDGEHARRVRAAAVAERSRRPLLRTGSLPDGTRIELLGRPR